MNQHTEIFCCLADIEKVVSIKGKRCLRTIFEKIVDIFGLTTIFWQFLPINGHQWTQVSNINPHIYYIFLFENIQYTRKICNR